MNEDYRGTVAIHKDHSGNRFTHEYAAGLHSVIQTHEHGEELGKPRILHSGTKESAEKHWREVVREETVNETIGENTFYRVNKPITFHHLIGHTPSNSYYGASRLQDPVHKKITLKPGDEVHHLVGGTHVVHKGKVLSGSLVHDPNRGHFEKDYGGTYAHRDHYQLQNHLKSGHVTQIAQHQARQMGSPGSGHSYYEQSQANKDKAWKRHQRHERRAQKVIASMKKPVVSEAKGVFGQWAAENRAARSISRERDRAMEKAYQTHLRTQKKERREHMDRHIAQLAQHAVAEHYPDSDGLDHLQHQVHKHYGIHPDNSMPHINRAVRKHLGARDYHGYLNQVHKQYKADNPGVYESVNESEWSDIPSYMHAGLAHEYMHRVHAHMKATGSHPSEEEQGKIRKSVADNYRQKHPRGSLHGSTHPQSDMFHEGTSQEGDDFKPEDSNTEFAEQLKDMVYKQAANTSSIKEHAPETASLGLNFPKEQPNLVTKVESCGQCTRHVHSMIASGLEVNRAYQLAAEHHSSHSGVTEGKTIAQLREDKISKPRGGGRTLTGQKAHKISPKPKRLLARRMKSYYNSGF